MCCIDCMHCFSAKCSAGSRQTVPNRSVTPKSKRMRSCNNLKRHIHSSLIGQNFRARGRCIAHSKRCTAKLYGHSQFTSLILHFLGIKHDRDT